MLELIIGVLEQSFIYGIGALGAYISYKILNFPDMSVEGVFPLGASITVLLIVKGINPWLVCIIAFLLGMGAGIITGFLHITLKITDLLSGIIMLTALYSVNLLITGSANFPIFNESNIFTIVKNENSIFNYFSYGKLLITFLICFTVKILIDLYLKTKSGFLLKATGDNPQFVTSLSKNVGMVKILGLSIASGLTALSGSIWCQYQRVFDVGMGRGVIITSLSSVIIGINLMQRFCLTKDTTKTLLGCVLYNGTIAFAVFIGVSSHLMNLVTAGVFLSALIMNQYSKGRGMYAEN